MTACSSNGIGKTIEREVPSRDGAARLLPDRQAESQHDAAVASNKRFNRSEVRDI